MILRMLTSQRNIIEKMITGRLAKELKEICLLEQEYVKAENKETVAKYLEMVSKEVGTPVELKRFVRFETGEGLEKKNEDSQLRLLLRWVNNS